MKQLLILITLILAGCSAQKKETGATFKVGIRSLTAAGTVSEFPGGLMLFGKTTGRSFGRIMAASSQDEMIPNGVWDFYVIGWDGSGLGTPMTGKVYCALQTGVALNGDPVEINLKATNANCAAPVFGGVYVDGNGDNHFPQINIQTCNSIDAVTQSTVCEYTVATAATYKKTKGSALSYAIMASSYDKVGPDFRVFEGSKYRSGCSVVASGFGTTGGLQINSFTNDDLNIPAGSPGSPFAFNLRAYFGSSTCNDSYGHMNIPMLHGAKPMSPKAVGIKTATSETTIFTKITEEDVCAWTGANPGPFRGGNGTNGLPYVICNGAELNAIGSAHVANHFVLGRDIDMNPYSAALADGNTPACVDEGDNYFPIGGYDASCSGPPSSFSGTFDGLGKTIKGLRLNKGNESNMGFIRVMGGGGKLVNTNFKSLELEGLQVVGLVGYANPGSVIYNVEVSESRIEADQNYVGTILGKGYGSIIQNVAVEDGSLRAQGQIGGIVGYLGDGTNASSLTKAVFNGFIEGENAFAIGGIVGEAVAGSIDQAASKGAVFGGTNNIGGIVGSLNGTSVTNVYSKMYFSPKDNPTYVGGLVGMLGTATLSNGYFAGRVDARCSGGPCSMAGEIYGDGTPPAGLVNVVSFIHSVYNSAQTTTCDDTTLPKNSGTCVTNITAGHETKWSLSDLRYPRLAFEKSGPCDVSDAFTICTRSELEAFLTTNGAGEAYTLGDDIALGLISGPGLLSASLDGKGHSIMGLEVPAADDVGLFSTIETGAQVRNLKLLGAEIVAPFKQRLGAMASVNKGLIEDVVVSGVVGANQRAGIMVYENQGMIRKSRVGGFIYGTSFLGGVAAINRGTIELVEAEVEFSPSTFTSIGNLGGVVAHNEGTVSKTSVRSEMRIAQTTHLTPATTTLTGVVGGFVGFNKGQIINSMVEDQEIRINGNAASGLGVGGFAGENDLGAVIENSYTLSDIRVEDGVLQSSFAGFVGNNQGSIIDSVFQEDVKKMLYFYNSISSPTFNSLTCSGGPAPYSLNMSLSAAVNPIFQPGDIIESHGSSYYGEYTNLYLIDLSSASTANIVFQVNEDCSGAGSANEAKIYRPQVSNNATAKTDMQTFTTYSDLGWDIAEFGGVDEQRLLDYYKMILMGGPAVTPPVWEFNAGETPRLVELDN